MHRHVVRFALVAWIVLAALPTRGQDDDCGPLPPEIANLLPSDSLRCGVGIQSFVTGARGDFGGTRVMLMLDDNGAVRGLRSAIEPEVTLVFPAGVTAVGSNGDILYWGQWPRGPVRRFEGTAEVGSYVQGGAMAYVAGVRTRALSTSGTVDYELLGEPRVVSRSNAGTDTDNESNPIAPGTIRGASVRVDFAAGTAVARFPVSVRGAAADVRFNLAKRDITSDTFEVVDCDGPTCPFAELRFYGGAAELAGLRFSFDYNVAMPEPVRVAAKLNNVTGYAVVALRRRP
jgi:hypothetical protein